MSASATLALTLSFLTVDTAIDKRGKTTEVERSAYTTTSIVYDTRQACANAKEEWNLAVGAYQMSKRPARVIMAVCNDSATGTVQ
jgi:hypothetical protein